VYSSTIKLRISKNTIYYLIRIFTFWAKIVCKDGFIMLSVYLSYIRKKNDKNILENYKLVKLVYLSIVYFLFWLLQPSKPNLKITFSDFFYQPESSVVNFHQSWRLILKARAPKTIKKHSGEKKVIICRFKWHFK
jgi:hypothetical protein